MGDSIDAGIAKERYGLSTAVPCRAVSRGTTFSMTGITLAEDYANNHQRSYTHRMQNTDYYPAPRILTRRGMDSKMPGCWQSIEVKEFLRSALGMYDCRKSQSCIHSLMNSVYHRFERVRCAH
jgi:hypothetical protein